MSSIKNLELKYYCNKFEEVRITLTSLGANQEPEITQKDYFFNMPEGSKGKMKFRIRNGNLQKIAYYERPEFEAGSETESQIELYESSDEQLLTFLRKSLGVLGIVNKTREIWRLENTVFHLDTVDGVGTLFEMEVQTSGEIEVSDKEKFNLYQKLLLPLLEDSISGSNIDLVL